MLAIAPTQTDVFVAVRSFLVGILPDGAAAFKGTIDGSTLTVIEMLGQNPAPIELNDVVLGNLVMPGTRIAALTPGGRGGPGQYSVSPPQAFPVPQSTMSTGVEVIQAQVNRVPEPISPDFVVMNTTRMARFATNIDEFADCTFTASISGTTMTVSDGEIGAIEIGATIWGEGISADTIVISQTSDGVYQISPAQTVSSTLMAAGGKTMLQIAQCTIQLDVHGPNSADNAQIIATAFRDEFAVERFEAINTNITPLYSQDPRQIPFINGEQQYEDRWVIELELEVDQSVRVPQQFADTLNVDIVSVEAD